MSEGMGHFVAQVRAIARGAGGRVETLVLPGCGYSPHRERPQDVLAAAAGFVRGVLAGSRA